MLIGLFLSLAFADSLTLDSGATLQGELAVYQYGGDCQISVSEGELRGAIVIVPCAHINRLERSADPAVATVVAPEAPAEPVLSAPAEDLSAFSLTGETFAAQIPAPETEEAPADAPVLDGVPMDAAVTVDPGLLPDGRPAARVPSPGRTATPRPPGPPAAMPLAIPPNPDGTAKMGW